jgi:phosphoribosylaminoimidazole carboxylase PurE protein
MATPQVGVVMGSSSDWEVMRHAADRLGEFGIRYETRVVSAHRTPDLLFEYAQAVGCVAHDLPIGARAHYDAHLGGSHSGLLSDAGCGEL